MGTPHFAVSTLNALIASNHQVVAVYTRADKARGRGKKITFSPVKEVALQHEIPVEQPTTLKTEEALETLKQYNADCIVVAAYGMILPQSVLDLPKYGCVNVHASLLPKYRGAAPINRCIMEGENESGVTIMQMDAGLDTGAMLLSETVPIREDMTASELHNLLAEVGGTLLVNALDDINNLTHTPQDARLSNYAEKLLKPECQLDFSKPARVLFNQVRGLADYPCAFTFYNNKRIKVYRAIIVQKSEESIESINFECGDGQILALTEIQPEGGKRMKTVDYLRGISIKHS